VGRMAVGVEVWIGVDGRGLRAVRRALKKKERGREDVQVGRTGRGCEALVGRDCTSVSRGVNAMLSMLTSSFAGVHGRVRGRVHYAMVVLGPHIVVEGHTHHGQANGFFLEYLSRMNPAPIGWKQNGRTSSPAPVSVSHACIHTSDPKTHIPHISEPPGLGFTQLNLPRPTCSHDGSRFFGDKGCWCGFESVLSDLPFFWGMVGE
jgi:hypothetical protein